MDRKQDASKDLLNEVTILIENNKILELRELLEEYHIIDIFEIMENLEENEKIKYLKASFRYGCFYIRRVMLKLLVLSNSDTENKKEYGCSSMLLDGRVLNICSVMDLAKDADDKELQQ